MAFDRYAAAYMDRKNPRHKEHFKAVDWITLGFLYSAIFAFVFALIALPLGHLVSAGFSKISLDNVTKYYVYVKEHPVYFFKSYFKWMLEFGTNPMQSFGIWVPTFPLFIFVIGILISVHTCPYYFGTQQEGSGRLADERDLKKMKIWNGLVLVLGSWKGRLLKLSDYSSIMCIAAPATGKTTGVIIPTIFESDDKCLMIHDPKGELFNLTSGHRASLGNVFRLNFGGLDIPEQGIFWPTWNPLGEGDLPPPCPGRQMYIGGLAFFLLGDGPQGTDPYWIKAGRSALEGFTNYICDKCDQARANDYFLQRLFEDSLDDEDLDVLETYYVSMAKTKEVKQALEHVRKGTLTLKNYLPIGKWDPIPDAWVGRQSSFPMLTDFIFGMQLEITHELRARRDAGDPVAFKTDIWAKILENTIEECIYFGYNRRILVELNQILSLPKTQRSSVLSMALSGLAPFKNAAIRSRMASGDFVACNFRGMKNPFTGQWQPITFYITAPPDPMSNIMFAMFVNMTSGILTIFAPAEGPCGPYPFLYILDEYQWIPNFNVADAMGVGYAKKFAYLITCHDLSQLSARYGGAVETIFNNVGAKIFMRVNNEITADRLNSMVEKDTKVIVSTNRREGLNVAINPFEHNISLNTMADSVIGTSSMLNMSFGTQYALLQKFHNRPVKLKTPFYFNNREMVKKSKLAPAPFITAHIYDARRIEDKLPPQEMSVERAYNQGKKLADLDE